MRLFIGDDRGQLKLVDLQSGGILRFKTQMDRMRAILSVEATGARPKRIKKEKCKKRCLSKCFEESIAREIIESEITVGRSNGMVQAYDIASVPDLDAFIEDPEAITRDLDGKCLTTAEAVCVRSFKLVGKIIFMKFLGGMFCGNKYPELKNALLVVSSTNEVVVVDWVGSWHLGRSEKFKHLNGNAEEDARYPMSPMWLKEVDFSNKFTKCANSPYKRGIKEELVFLSTEEETLLFNQSMADEASGDCPVQLLHGYKLLNKHQKVGSNDPDENTLICADVDLWTGSTRVMVGGDNCMVRVFDFITGEPIWAPKNAKSTNLDLQQTGDSRLCRFMSSCGNGSIVAVGTRLGEVLLYDMDDESRQPSFVMTGTNDNSALCCSNVRPRRCFTEDGLSYLRSKPAGGFTSMGICVMDFQGYGHLYRLVKRPDKGVYAIGTEFVPGESRKRLRDGAIFKVTEQPSEVLQMRKTFDWMLVPVRGFHPWIGTPKAIGFHESGKHIAVASFAQRAYSFDATKKGSQRTQHRAYLTTNPSSMYVSNAEYVEPIFKNRTATKEDY
eukprot:GHVH01013166.1.p1 GENE.GHVH01013166.1~~GHVH01013166.1.p1  ORF type:complete len:556 (-),score=72.95 GHVH01013166.1:47-1714(-)